MMMIKRRKKKEEEEERKRRRRRKRTFQSIPLKVFHLIRQISLAVSETS
jgi:hypothetical protein